MQLLIPYQVHAAVCIIITESYNTFTTFHILKKILSKLENIAKNPSAT
ncbi:hypothetical protein [uncultured Methanobrevibacter sp.]|nr:hypothetical protein [uncultured Methanobrevibacter sp.]